MTALTFQKLFSPGVLPNAVGIVYTCPTLTPSAVLKNGRVRFTNTTGGSVTVTAHAVSVGGTPGANNMFLNAVPIPGNGFLDVDIPTLAAGDTFQAFASAAASITVSEIGGVVFT